MFSCGGLRVDARVPTACPRSGCGLILLLHGDTGDGLLEDAHVKLRERGAARGYVVIAPTGPAIGRGDSGSTWDRDADEALVAIVRAFAAAFHADGNRIHVTGFSRGGFVTWRLLCDHADLFASAAPAAAGTGAGQGETTCFSRGRAPSRPVPILFLIGRNDRAVGYSTMIDIRNAVLARYGVLKPVVIASDGKYAHTRWTGTNGVVFETFEHSYETARDGPWGEERGHCIPGSTVSPKAPRYVLPCVGPNAFTWGEEVVRFFEANPKK